MRNFENSYNGQANTENTGWESLGDEEFEGRRVERANRRYERMQRSEAAARMKRKVAALAAAAILATTLVGGVAAGALSTPEIMNTSRAEEVEKFYAKSVTLIDGPNIRRNSAIPSEENGTNILKDIGEYGQRAHVPYSGPVSHYRNSYDPNGGWYGFPAEEFATALFENGFISKEEAERFQKEYDDGGDGWVWISEEYVEIMKAEPAHD